MSRTNSQADLIRRSESLLDAVERCSPEEKQALDRDNRAQAAALERLNDLKARQAELARLAAGVHPELAAAVTQVKDESLSLRAADKLVLGPRNERLSQSSVAPLRARRGVNVKKRLEKAGTGPGAPASTDPQPVV